jgi:hypothetical protein
MTHFRSDAGSRHKADDAAYQEFRKKWSVATPEHWGAGNDIKPLTLLNTTRVRFTLPLPFTMGGVKPPIQQRGICRARELTSALTRACWVAGASRPQRPLFRQHAICRRSR